MSDSDKKVYQVDREVQLFKYPIEFFYKFSSVGELL
jgi:hypothetical protein